MTIFISRDYSPATSGYTSLTSAWDGTWSDSSTSRLHVNIIYQLSIFLHKILDYSIVGQTNWNIDNTNIKLLTISAATNAVPIQITTTVPHGLIDGYTVSISGGTGNAGVNGTWSVHVINSTQCLLLGSAGTGSYTGNSATLTSGFLYAHGFNLDGYPAGINFGDGYRYEVSIPISKRAVISGDIGKILVLKSNLYPTKNSGLFKISGINSTYNRYVIDYRSTEYPPHDGYMDWWLYESETIAGNYLSKFNGGTMSISSSTNTSPIQITTANAHTLVSGQQIIISGHLVNTNANGTWTITQSLNGKNTFTLNNSVGNGVGINTGSFNLLHYTDGYTDGYGDGYSYLYNSRIILQSPHTLGWQVRLCAEPINSNLPRISLSVGFGGDGYGDFETYGNTTNIAEYLNANLVTNTQYLNMVTGGGNELTASRISMIGDDNGQVVFMYTRSLGATNNGMIMFGVADNESGYITDPASRVFCYGSASTSDFGSIILRTGATTNVGFCGSPHKTPQYCLLTGWANLDGSSVSPLWTGNASNSVFTGTTELLPIEIWSGTTTDVALGTVRIAPFIYNPLFIGTAPYLANGRYNFGNFTLSTEDVSSYTVSSATNTSPVQITTATTNSFVTGQTVTIDGATDNTSINGTWTIIVIDNSHFTLNGCSGNGNYSSGATVKGCPLWMHLQNGIYLQWNGATGLNA